MEPSLESIEKRLAHIESLLQRMPEMIAAALFIEREHADAAMLVGKTYSETVELQAINRR